MKIESFIFIAILIYIERYNDHIYKNIDKHNQIMIKDLIDYIKYFFNTNFLIELSHYN